MVLLIDFVGFAGALMILAAFVSSSLAKLSRGSYLYMLVNGGGATLLVYYAYATGVWAFVLLNVVWLSVELYYAYKKFFKGHKRK